MDFSLVLIAFALAFFLVVIITAAAMRAQREKHRVQLQKAILERVGSVKDLGEFLTTEQGERFLSRLSPHLSPHHRSLWSVRVGIVLLIVGLFLMVGLHTIPLGPPGEQTSPRPLLLGILLLIAAGAGMLVSAVVSFMIASRLGMVDRSPGSPKNRSE
jgi:hypothetical protein